MYLPCDKRQEQQYHDQDGSLRPIQRCNHPSCEHFVKEVTVTMCAECPLRIATPMRPPEYRETQPTVREFGQPKLLEDGCLVYAKKGWEPPTTPAGYRPKSNDPRSEDAWVFIPLLKPCQDRRMVNSVKSCGCLTVTLMCDSQKSGHAGKTVEVADCNACPVARLYQIEQQ